MTQIAEPPVTTAVRSLPAVYEPTPNRVRFTRAQCDVIQEAGVLTGRYELIDGEIISKMGQNPPHGAIGVLLYAWLTSVFGALSVRIQTTIDIGDADPEHNRPEPDAAVTLEPTSAYFDRFPGPDDLALVAEISDSTVRFDRTTKAALYALAGIREYWIVDIAGQQVFIHRQPAPEGYAEVSVHGRDQKIATLARPEASVLVSDLLPPGATV
jgi:Uma2 family endonuclease